MTDLIITKKYSDYANINYNLTKDLQASLLDYSLNISIYDIDQTGKLYHINSELIQQQKSKLKELYNLNDNDIKKINKEVKNILNSVNKKNYFTSIQEWSKKNALKCYNLINSYCYRLSKTLASKINIKNELLYK